MKKTVTFANAIEHSVRLPKNITDTRTFRQSKFAKFLQDGHMISGMMACVWKTGDGKKYGWKSDSSMLGDAKHYGFKMIHVDKIVRT